MLHIILTILVGLVVLLLVVLIPIFLGWLSYKLSTVPIPYWLYTFTGILIILFILTLAYNLGQGILINLTSL